MKLKEQLEKINDVQINEAFVNQVEGLYNKKIPDDVKKIISISSETVFYDDRPLLRGLSNSEIINAKDDLDVDFVSMLLLPIFDLGDNDFVTFDFSDNSWFLFNIVEEVKFKKAACISMYL